MINSTPVLKAVKELERITKQVSSQPSRNSHTGICIATCWIYRIERH